MATLLSVLALLLSDQFSFLGATTIALLLGLALANSRLNTTPFQAGLKFTEKVLLEAAIVLLAFGLNAKVFSQLGWLTWGFVAFSVLLVFLSAYGISRWFGLSAQMGALLGAGSAICGSAAIGAVAPLLHSKEEETGLSIGVINLLSTLALFMLPLLASSLALAPAGSGLLIGGIIQSMGHVVGAGFAVNAEVGALATMIKMGRVLLLIPLLIILYFVGRSRVITTSKTSFPLFIPLFVGCTLLAQLPAFPLSWAKALAQAGDYLLLAAMVAIGYKIHLKSLITMAGPALLAGILIFIGQLVLYLGFLYFG